MNDKQQIACDLTTVLLGKLEPAILDGKVGKYRSYLEPSGNHVGVSISWDIPHPDPAKANPSDPDEPALMYSCVTFSMEFGEICLEVMRKRRDNAVRQAEKALWSERNMPRLMEEWGRECQPTAL